MIAEGDNWSDWAGERREMGGIKCLPRPPSPPLLRCPPVIFISHYFTLIRRCASLNLNIWWRFRHKKRRRNKCQVISRQSCDLILSDCILNRLTDFTWCPPENKSHVRTTTFVVHTIKKPMRGTKCCPVLEALTLVRFLLLLLPASPSSLRASMMQMILWSQSVKKI